MSDDRRWGDRDRDWRNDRDRYEYGERGRQDERAFGRYGGQERYGENEQGRRSGGRMDYDAGNPGRFGRESWGGGQPYGGGDWPNYASDYEYRRDYRGSGSEQGEYGRESGRGYGGSRSERGGSYGSSSYGSGGYGSGAYSSGYGSGMSSGSGWRSNQDYGQWRGESGRSYGGSRGDDDRNWFDKAGDEVQSWFGDHDAERRRHQDRMREGEHRGRGPSGYRRSDERIREDVNDRLSDDAWLDASNIEVQVHNGEVTLNGTVHDRRDKRHAEDLAERVSGVQHVQNNLRVKTTTSNLATSGSGTGQTQAGTGASSATVGAGSTTGTSVGGSSTGTSGSNLTGATSSTGSTGSQTTGAGQKKETI